MAGKTHEKIETPVDEIEFATTGLEAPTYFVEHIRGALVSGGFVKLNMIEHRLDAIDQSIKSVHVVTVIIPFEQTRPWAQYLTDIADRKYGSVDAASEEPQTGA